MSATTVMDPVQWLAALHPDDRFRSSEHQIRCYVRYLKGVRRADTGNAIWHVASDLLKSVNNGEHDATFAQFAAQHATGQGFNTQGQQQQLIPNSSSGALPPYSFFTASADPDIIMPDAPPLLPTPSILPDPGCMMVRYHPQGLSPDDKKIILVILHQEAEQELMAAYLQLGVYRNDLELKYFCNRYSSGQATLPVLLSFFNHQLKKSFGEMFARGVFSLDVTSAASLLQRVYDVWQVYSAVAAGVDMRPDEAYLVLTGAVIELRACRGFNWAYGKALLRNILCRLE